MAGREWTTDGNIGAWIRPVSERENLEVSYDERRYEDGSDPQLLDIIDIPMKSSQPMDHQTENWLLDSDYYWEKSDVCSSDDLALLVDPVELLWIDGYSTESRTNDRFPSSKRSKLSDSLRLIDVNDFCVDVVLQQNQFGSTLKRVNGQFSFAGSKYVLSVTDPTYENRFRKLSTGTYPLGKCFLTVSLGEPFHGYIYKFIAAIFERDG